MHHKNDMAFMQSSPNPKPYPSSVPCTAQTQQKVCAQANAPLPALSNTALQSIKVSPKMQTSPHFIDDIFSLI